MLSGLEATNSAGLGKTKPCPENLGLIEYRSLCDMLAVTRPTLNKMAKDKGFPKRIKLGKVFYIRLADLKNWIDAR